MNLAICASAAGASERPANRGLVLASRMLPKRRGARGLQAHSILGLANFARSVGSIVGSPRSGRQFGPVKTTPLTGRDQLQLIDLHKNCAGGATSSDLRRVNDRETLFLGSNKVTGAVWAEPSGARSLNKLTLDDSRPSWCLYREPVRICRKSLAALRLPGCEAST